MKAKNWYKWWLPPFCFVHCVSLFYGNWV